MRKLKLVVSVTLIAVSLGLVILAIAPHAGAGFTRRFDDQDPDLRPGEIEADKATYLQKRNEWTMLRRGFDPAQPFDPTTRERAIQQMGRQLANLETVRRQQLLTNPNISTTSWTPVGPVPIPQGQTDTLRNAISGRVISLAVHPTNPDIVFVGTASGGLFRTLNGQAANPTWTPMMDTVQMQSNGATAIGTLAIGAIAFSPSNPSIVYVGTGEATGSEIGNGVYRIDNATAASPTLTGPINPAANYGDPVAVNGAFTRTGITQILVHPTDPATILVSTANAKAGLTTHNDSNPPGIIIGLFRSTNAMASQSDVTFTKIRVNGEGGYPTGDTDISDMVFDPADATANTVLLWVRSGRGVLPNNDPGSSVPACAGPNDDCAGIYRSTNVLAATPSFARTLTALNNGVRGELTVNKVGATVTVVAATGENPASVPGAPNATCGGHLGLIRRSIDGGVTWPNTDVTAADQPGLLRNADGFCGGQCFYDIAVAIDPADATKIQIGGTAFYGGCQVLTKRSTDGLTFNRNSAGLHGDVQVMRYAPSNSAIVWNGNDGGLWRSTDAGANWTNMNGDPASSTNAAGKLSAAQYIGISTHPRDREYLTGGTQDNGTHFKRAASDTGEWMHVADGDGGYTAIDQNATDAESVTVYHTYNASAGSNAKMEFERVVSTTNLKGKNWTSFACVAGGASNTRVNCNDTAVSFYPPMVLGPGNPNTVYYGTDRLYRSADQGTTMQQVSQGPIVSGKEIVSISIGRTNDNVRLVGLRDGTVWATTNGSTTLTDVTPANRPAGATVGKVYVDPNDSNTAYIGYGGLGTASAPLTHLWKTTNLAGGASTWVAMSNGLPDVPVDAIVADRLTASGTGAATTVYLGTDIGVYQSTDGGTNWTVFNPGNTLPVLPIFDIAFQQEEITSSRILRVATHGRGIWEIQTAGAPLPTVQFAAASTRVGESTGTANIPVNRTGDTSVPTTVRYSTGGGTATPGQDYTPESGEITFAPGETSKMITVPILSDPNPEGNETFVVALSPPGPGASSDLSTPADVGPIAQETVTIVDDDGGGPVVSQVVSRKLHNGTPFDVNLLSGGSVGVEPRSGGPGGSHQVVFTFANSVTTGDASVTSGNGTVTSVSGSGTNTATVNLTSVVDAQTITVTLFDVTDQNGAFDVSVTMSVLLGDANGDGMVNSGDVTLTRNRSGHPTDETNFRADYNTDGMVNSGDATIVRNRSGNFLP